MYWINMSFAAPNCTPSWPAPHAARDQQGTLPLFAALHGDLGTVWALFMGQSICRLYCEGPELAVAVAQASADPESELN